LVDAGLLRVVSARENLDTPMYISLCDLNFAQMVAKLAQIIFILKQIFLLKVDLTHIGSSKGIFI
jgi:hypothetical protein